MPHVSHKGYEDFLRAWLDQVEQQEDDNLIHVEQQVDDHATNSLVMHSRDPGGVTHIQ